MPNIAPFEKYIDMYDAWFEQHFDLYQAELEAIRRLLPSPAVEGLEVGVGSGKFAVPLGIKTGVEPSQKMANKARMLGIEVYPGVAEALPFSDRSFGFVLMVTTLCFVDDVSKSFTEAHRVLSPGGCFIVGLVDKESDLGKRYAIKKEKSKFYKYATFYSTQEVLTHFKNAGFEIVAIRQTLIPEEPPQTILEGYGRGAFVVVKGVRKKPEGA